MKPLQIIAALCITNSLSLHSSECRDNNKTENYSGLELYHPRYVSYYSLATSLSGPISDVHTYCAPSWKDAWIKNTKNLHNCRTLNAYLLLSRRPEETVEQQLEYYKKDLDDTTKQLDSTFDIFKKNTLETRQKFLKSIIPQIEQAHLSGKPQDHNIQNQVNYALNNMNTYNATELGNLKWAVEQANRCNFLGNNQ